MQPPDPAPANGNGGGGVVHIHAYRLPDGDITLTPPSGYEETIDAEADEISEDEPKRLPPSLGIPDNA
jgi:hypothetical protein